VIPFAGRWRTAEPPLRQYVSVDLDIFTALVDQWRSFWEQQGIEAEFRGPGPTSSLKPSASVRCEGSKRIAEFVVWTTGEADLFTAPLDLPPSDWPSVRHYEITTEIELRGCLADLTEYLLADD
jgi:hypothetical protein